VRPKTKAPLPSGEVVLIILFCLMYYKTNPLPRIEEIMTTTIIMTTTGIIFFTLVFIYQNMLIFHSAETNVEKKLKQRAIAEKNILISQISKSGLRPLYDGGFT